jgi:hypothetical protein
VKATVKGALPVFPHKTELNNIYFKIIRRAATKAESLYVCQKMGEKHQATVQLIALPDAWAQRAWAGHLSDTKQAAEQSAAEQALVDIMAANP